MKSIHPRVDEEFLKKLESLARKNGVSVQTLIIMEIKELLSGFVDDSAEWSPQEP